MFAVRFSACLKLLREGACFNEDGSRFHANGPLYLKVVLPISKLNLGDIKELVFRKLYARELVLGRKRPIILSEVRLYWTLYISDITAQSQTVAIVKYRNCMKLSTHSNTSVNSVVLI